MTTADLRAAILSEVAGIPEDLLDDVLPILGPLIEHDRAGFIDTIRYWFATPAAAINGEAAVRRLAMDLSASTAPPPMEAHD